ncbi:YdcF family protein [Prauserella aidingensis]|uniref:YdcF family protein n=1 Tax=Prauserella aidingensis TaxID=387890 RepID=UPI0020A5FDE5|nr:YdcF family protein [Prauserella aidingensis]
MRATTVAAAAVLAVLCWGEFEHWRSSRRWLGTARGAGAGPEVVVVLGYGNRGTRANVVNRWRVRAGLRSRTPGARLILTGGAVAGPVPEATVMATYARRACGYAGPLATETASRTTWENVVNVAPLLEDAGRIAVVSHALHAEKARLWLWRLRPDLAARLTRGREYRFGEWILAKPALAVLGRRGLRAMLPPPVTRAAGGDTRRQHGPMCCVRCVRTMCCALSGVRS